MSEINSENLPILFFETIKENIFTNEITAHNCSFLCTDSRKEIPLKPIKFILTKEKAPAINLLQKKTIKIKESNDSNGGRWNKEEKRLFAEAVLKYGNDWKKIQKHIISRNLTQVRSHAQKFLMKLKENHLIINQRIDLSLSWTKMMNYLKSFLSYEKLKNLLFSVEQNEDKKIEKKKVKKISKKNIENIENFDTNSNLETNSGNFIIFEDEKDKFKYNIKNKTIVKEEDEEQILKKFIECFNSTSGNITLNTSFEEEFDNEKENEKDIFFNLLNDKSINYYIIA